MIVFLKIALRNILKNKKRSVLIGLAIFVSCCILLLSNGMANGTAKEFIKGYYYTQAGDVVVFWKNAKQKDPAEMSRVFSSEFKTEQNRENLAAIKHMYEFLDQHKGEIEYIFPVVSEGGDVDTEKATSYTQIFGITQRELDFLAKNRVLELGQGDWLNNREYMVCISKDLAKENDIKVGDLITLECTTPFGAKNAADYEVAGIYKSYPPWFRWFVHMEEDSARQFLDFGAQYFNWVKIFLKNKDQAGDFTRELDSYLLQYSDVLRVETGATASTYYSDFAQSLKFIFIFFVLFLLLLIAIGIRSTVRMNLFERMREFGTLRAIGFSRIQNYFIIFSEIFLLCLISLVLATVFCSAVILLLGNTGIYVGEGEIIYVFGGEYLYPELKLNDTLFALVIITIFSLFAPLKPGLKLCYQKITDILAKRQKKFFVSIKMIKDLRNQCKRRTET